MTIDKMILRSALIAFTAFGAVQSANAAQLIEPHLGNMTHGKLKLEATKLHRQVQNPDTVVPQLAGTAVLQMMHASRLGNLHKFATDYAKAAAAKIKHYIDTELLAADGPFLDAAVANTLNNPASVAAAAAVLGWAAAGGGAGGANFQPDEMPADLTRDAFTTALTNRMAHVTAAQLNTLNPLGAIPARFTEAAITATRNNIRNAIQLDIQRWMDALMPGGDNAVFIAAIPNAGGNALIAGAPGMPQPATINRNAVTAALQAVVDLVDAY